jgi:two-component system response regulator FixJ
VNQHRSIYVVEDNPGMREYLRLLFADRGYTCQSFENGEDFLAAYPDLDPGCVILDMHMPRKNGLQVQAEMARLGEALPVVAVTGHGDAEMAVDSMRLGAVDFLQKPFEEEMLFDAIDLGFAKLGGNAGLGQIP